MLQVGANRKVKINKKIAIPLAILGALIIVVLVAGIYFNVFLNSPAGKSSTEIPVTIESGTGVRAITDNLEEKGLITNKVLFLVYLKLHGLVGNIRAGNYLIAQTNTPLEVADILTKGKVASRKITIPEGWTVNQMGDYLQKQGVVKKSDFLAATKKHYDYDFLKDAPADAGLEGFLFPDTYQIPFDATADDIVKKMLDNFNTKLTSEIKNEIAASGYNTYQVVTLASVVEKEVSKSQDRKLVAGIFLKRLNIGMPLQSDVTVLYALNSTKKSLTTDEISVDSPYNTYKYSGLPYGPICNPGTESVQSVLNFQDSDFLYFLAKQDGSTVYAKTLEEQEANKQKYLQ